MAQPCGSACTAGLHSAAAVAAAAHAAPPAAAGLASAGNKHAHTLAFILHPERQCNQHQLASVIKMKPATFLEGC